MNKRPLVATLAAAALMAASTTASMAQQRLAMGATHSASSFYTYQVGIANFLNSAVDGLDLSVQELGGAEVSTQALLRKEVDMGIAVTSSDFAAVKGNEPFQGPVDELRTLYYFAPLPLNFVVAADSGIKDLDGLKGVKFNPGGRGSSTERQVDQLLETLTIVPDLQRAEGGDALDAFQNRRIDAFVKGGVHPDGYIQQAASSREIRFLSMTKEQQTAVSEAHGYFSPAKVDPGDFYGTAGEIQTVQTAIGINTTSDLDEELAYRIAKAIFSDAGKTAEVEVYAPGKNVDTAQLTIDAAVAPLHPGVIRYLKEAGYTIPDRLIP
jgi:TRAP transporter TAXI family solute receptor